MRRLVLSALAVGLIAGIDVLPVSAMSLRDRVATCQAIKSDTLKIGCLDAIQIDAVDAAPAVEVPAVTTKQTLQTPQRAFRVVDPLDFVVAPSKFLNVGVELRRVQCFYADKNDYRCFTSGAETVTVFTVEITPEQSRQEIEDNCGSARVAIASPKCRRTIRFSPVTAETEKVSPISQRLTVITKSIEIVRSPTGNRR